MKAIIFTSGFPNGFTADFNDILRKTVNRKKSFALIASGFETYEKTDRYFKQWLKFFGECGIIFEESYVIDGRTTPDAARETAASADVLWLSGGDTLAQFKSIESYGLIPVLQNHEGVIIGMSAGAINMAKTSVLFGEPPETVIYQGIGLADISVEPHFDKTSLTDEILRVTKDHPVYGLCDEGFIVCQNNGVSYYGDVFLIDKGAVKQIFNQ